MGNEIDASILEFSQHRPLWQQDLFRRVFSQQSCSTDDLEEVMLLLKGEHGLHSVGSAEPLSAAHIRFSETASQVIVLRSISETSNVNRLMSDQELPFAPHGITLVYGDNGSGKSGYCRILRQLCRARRERPERVLGNVYASSPPPPAQAKITYSVDNHLTEHFWVDGSPAPKDLSRLTLFDVNAAPIYVDKQNQIEFLPEGLDVLPRAGSALQTLSASLDSEIDMLSGTLQHPVISVQVGTPTGLLINRLIATNRGTLPTTEEIQQSGTWSRDDEQALISVRQTLITISEPAKAAAKSRRMKASLEKVVGLVSNASTLLSDASISGLRSLQVTARSTRETAKTVAAESFQHDPFGAQVGTSVWRNLFRYAREFSEVVYPEESFPVTGPEKYCVLCQQPLSEPASDRLRRFHEFVTASAARDAERKEQEYVERLGLVKQMAISSGEELRSTLGEYTASESRAEVLVNAAADFCDAVRLRRDYAAQDVIPESLDRLPALPASPLGSLREAVELLETKGKEYDQAPRDTSKQATYEKQRDELEARRLLSTELARVLERRELLEKLSKLRACRAACDTTAISRKASGLRDNHVNGGFAARLSSELANLGIDYLPLKVASKSERGASYVGIALEQTAGARTAAVLSEGEFRVLALACFLAEVGGIQGHNGIIVDDPVSSLDHRHIRQVARRLVEEAAMRPQVIIFTHNLPFYYELLEASQEASVPVEAHWVQRLGAAACGKVDVNDAPWQVKKVRQRLVTLEVTLKGIPDPAQISETDFAAHVKVFYGLLRETWERLVEERLLNGVVGRFEPGVKTQSLKGVVVEDTDYQTVFAAMKKASRYSGHDGAPSFQTSMPSTGEMRQDLDSLRAYEQALKKRSDQVDDRRRELEEPIKAKTA